MPSVTSFLWHQTIFQDNPIEFSHVLTLSLDEASCGWVRIIISHKTNVHVQALNECNFVSLGEFGNELLSFLNVGICFICLCNERQWCHYMNRAFKMLKS